MGNLLVLLIALLILFIVFYFISGRDILSPPIIMTAMFIFSTVFALVNTKEWNIQYDIRSCFILVTGIVAFFIPYEIVYMVRSRYKISSKTYGARILSVSKGKWLLTIMLDIIILFIYGSAIINLVRSTGYVGTNIQWQYRNMTGTEGTEYLSGMVRFLIRFIDVTSLIGSYIFINNVMVYKKRIRNNLYYLVPAFLYCIKSLMGGGRQDLLRLLAFFIVASYILNHKKTGWEKNISFKYIVIGIITFIVILPLFYYALTLTGRSTTRTMFQSISTYVGGSIQHFNQYVMEPSEKSKYFGSESLTPILNILGRLEIIDYQETVHLEFRKLGVTSGNIYTFFRRPLHDFGILGMYIFTMMVSLFFSIYYLLHIKYSNLTGKKDLTIIVYSYLIYWIVMSSIEQYSMIVLSAQTVLIIGLLIVMWHFYFNVEISRFKIRIFRHAFNE